MEQLVGSSSSSSDILQDDTLDQNQVDQLFKDLRGDLDDDDDLRLPEPLDHEALEESLRKSSSKDQSDLNISGGGNTDQLDSKRISRIVGSRRAVVRLDEERLKDQRYGIPKLISLSKQFKPSSKGNEKEDLRRILKMYRIWSHEMFPKGSFGETIEQIEKLGHKRIIRSALKSWSDESTEEPKKRFKKMTPAKSEPTTRIDESERFSEQIREVSMGTAVDVPLFRRLTEEEENEYPVDEDLERVFEELSRSKDHPILSTKHPTVLSNITAISINTRINNDKTNQKSITEDLEEDYAEEEELLRQAEEEQLLKGLKNYSDDQQAKEKVEKTFSLEADEEFDEDDLYH
ncbi:replication fork protection component Swi3-domain-containing protein [Phakopsora pachyrhizi]|nr:replication fork protection component Swi3-domain-containing protein [Phakopsora pachyrhizi]